MNTAHKNFILGLSLYTLATSTGFAQVTVNCPTDSIQDALASAPTGGGYTITINGICNENVVINRDHVQLIGGSGGGVTGVTPNINAITILRQQVTIDNLTVSNGGGVGIALFQNASATISNSTVENNTGYGIDVSQGAFARLENNTISGNRCDVIVFDSGTLWMIGNTITSNQPDASICGGLSLYRDAFVRLRGTNSVTNTTPTGLAIDVVFLSTFRQDGGHTTVSGDLRVGDTSSMEFRDADITGDVNAFENSVFRARNSTITGDIFVNETNMASFSSVAPTTINGTIHCNGGTLFGESNVTATTIDCPAPLHVLRDNGTAKVLAQDTQVPANPGIPQVMFELRRPGAVRFDLVDESNGTDWVFQNRLDAFDITKAGTGVQEFKLQSGGNLIIQGMLTQGSDRARKTGITAVNASEVLAKLTTLPISQWAYKHEPTVHHIGPVAQDFKAAFDLGVDDKHLAPGDLAGVAVAGIKELHKMIETRDARISALEARLAELEVTLTRVLATRQPVDVVVADTTQRH